ncbi:MAG: PEP-CTERM sorting domain-containing protein [Candidatus Eisenbacteria bacterium]|nr:PEP-CTERM sorting domain-containing protein [Candidatus Eisenbacteria bacterium]
MRVLLALFAALLLVGASANATIMWGASAPGWGTGSPDIYQVDTGTGQVVTGSKWSYSGYNWIMGMCDGGSYLYATADLDSDQGQMLVHKIDKSSGAILTSTNVAGLLGTDYSHINALEYYDGKLYGVENCTWDETYRGNIIEMTLDASGDVTAATAGAYVGLAPDGALDIWGGTAYASTWKSGGDPGESWIATLGVADLGDSGKNFDRTLYTTPASGLMDGWQMYQGNLISVSWQNTGLYQIDPTTGNTTTLFSSITGLTCGHSPAGLDRVIPEPGTYLLLGLGLGSLVLIRRRRKA